MVHLVEYIVVQSHSDATVNVTLQQPNLKVASSHEP